MASLPNLHVFLALLPAGISRGPTTSPVSICLAVLVDKHHYIFLSTACVEMSTMHVRMRLHPCIKQNSAYNLVILKLLFAINEKPSFRWMQVGGLRTFLSHWISPAARRRSDTSFCVSRVETPPLAHQLSLQPNIRTHRWGHCMKSHLLMKVLGLIFARRTSTTSVNLQNVSAPIVLPYRTYSFPFKA